MISEQDNKRHKYIYKKLINFESPLGILDFSNTKKLIYIISALVRKAKGTKNSLLFYVYDDGTVEKRIIIE